jgi:hypothetical protein
LVTDLRQVLLRELAESSLVVRWVVSSLLLPLHLLRERAWRKQDFLSLMCGEEWRGHPVLRLA